MKYKVYGAVLVLLCSMFFCVISASAAEITVDVDIAEEAITVSGMLDTNRAKTDLILKMTDTNGNLILTEFATSYLKNGDIVFKFPKILLPKTLSGGIYSVQVSGADFASPIVAVYEHVDLYTLLNILKEVSTSSAVGETICNYAKALQIDTADYKALSADGRSLFENVMRLTKYELPENADGDADKAKIKEQVKKLQKAYHDSICLALFESIGSKKTALAWLERYYHELGFDRDNASTAYDEKKIAEYMESVKQADAFSNRLIQSKSLATLSEVRDFLNESTLLTVISEKTGSEVKEMVLEFPELFAIERDQLQKLSVTKQGTCFHNIAGKVYPTYNDAASAINAEISKLNQNNTSGGSTLGGGGGNKGGVITAKPTTKPNTDDENKEEVSLFSDMKHVAWAQEAVEFLLSRGICNGRDSETFAPDEYVTRAEFIKMVVKAMGLKTESEDTPFSDVSADDWYAPYALAAYKQGIALGDERGSFRPNETITRQDMAVMLYRALAADKPTADASFTDFPLVAAYAKDAVSYFSQRGIINGMGDGSYAPEQNASRAQAAVILYRIICEPAA